MNKPTAFLIGLLEIVVFVHNEAQSSYFLSFEYEGGFASQAESFPRGRYFAMFADVTAFLLEPFLVLVLMQSCG